jgi:L-erythro-3,5-diaminohexanoate dehydrogenase
MNEPPWLPWLTMRFLGTHRCAPVSARRGYATTSAFYRYGFHRVLEPARASCQAAAKLNNSAKLLHPTETLLSVQRLILDSTSARSLGESSDAAGFITGTVTARGKMHNPETESGGVLLATVREIGPDSSHRHSLTPGDVVVPLSSLTCIPLHLDRVQGFYAEAAAVEGTAVLFDSSPVARVPPDVSPSVAVLSLDISSLVPQVDRAIRQAVLDARVGGDDRRVSILVQGLGKSGLAAISCIRRLEASGQLGSRKLQVLGSDTSETAVSSAVVREHADAVAQLDAREPLATLDFLAEHGQSDGCDLVLATHNQSDCGASAVFAAREFGRVIFFSMATNFAQANLATDTAGKDVACSFGVGLAHQQGEAMFQLLRDDPLLRAHFEALATELSEELSVA